jgi:hypothetical protein
MLKRRCLGNASRQHSGDFSYAFFLAQRCRLRKSLATANRL